MKRLFKFVALVLAFGLAMPTCGWADPLPLSVGTGATATMDLMGDGTLTVTPVGAITFTTSGVTFPSASPIYSSGPWVAANGHLSVVYNVNSNGTYVGIRIVTKNGELNPDGTFSPPPHRSAAGRIVPSLENIDTDPALESIYGGLILSADLDGDTTSEDPSKRAKLAWQVHDTEPGAITVPASTLAPAGGGRTGTVLLDKNTPAADSNSIAGTPASWNAAWAYISDVDDEGFPISLWAPGPPAGASYPVVALGLAGRSGVLAQHPQSALARVSSDGEIFIYLAARFVNTDWGPAGSTDPVRTYILPGGTSYRTRIYIELLHE